MATATTRYGTQLVPLERQRILQWPMKKLRVKRTVVLVLLFSALTFLGALYYVEQQIRLRTLNYDIIALKERKKQLVEEQKTLQLRLDQSKRLDTIEAEMRKHGFVPVEDRQIRIVETHIDEDTSE
jgi:hypothetical protein